MQNKIATSISVNVLDMTGGYILRTAVAEGNVNGFDFSVETAMNGSTVINCNKKQWVVPLKEILDQLLPQMIEGEENNASETSEHGSNDHTPEHSDDHI